MKKTKKFLIFYWVIVIICVIFLPLAVSMLSACKNNTTNPDGSPKNMAETLIDVDDEELSCLLRWADFGNTADSSIRVGTVRQLLNEGTDYNNYSGFSICWKKDGYKITKLEFDITSQTSTPITFDCNLKDAKNGEYKHLSEERIISGQTVHVVFDNLDCRYSKYAPSVYLKSNGSTTDKTVLNWKIKVSNLFITAEKV